MKAKKVKVIIAVVLVLIIGSIALQLLNHASQYTNVKSSLATTILDYNTLGEEKFKERLSFICNGLQLDLDPSNIEIVEEEGSERVTVKISYTRNLYILFFPIKRNIVVKKVTAKVDL